MQWAQLSEPTILLRTEFYMHKMEWHDKKVVIQETFFLILEKNLSHR